MGKLFYIPSKEKSYQSYMVFALTIIWAVVTGLTVSMGFYFFPHIWPRWLALLGVAIFFATFNLTLNRLGYVRIASWSLPIMIWLYITIPCYSAGGIMAPGIMSQMSVILTAGFLLGWRGGLAFGLLTIGTDFWLAYLQMSGQLPEPTVVHTPITRWIGAIIPFGTILALQYYATNHLRSNLIALQNEIKKREEAEKVKDQTVYDLGERVKELRTLYAISRILQVEEALPEKLCMEIATILPGSCQYPGITAAYVSIGGAGFHTPNYKPSEYCLRAEAKTTKGTKVGIEIVYLQPMQEFDEGPFLKEERSLINMLVEMLKIDWEIREHRAELKESEEKFRSLVEQTLVGVFILQENKFKYINPGFEKMIRYPKEELLNNLSFQDLIHEEDVERISKKYLLQAGEAPPDQDIFRAIRNDGEVIYIESILSGIIYNNKPAMIGTLVDVTDRMEEEKRIGKAVIDAQENERLQIGMELHDNVKQLLAATNITLGLAIHKIDDKDASVQLINDGKGFIMEAVDELRRLSHQLAPSVDSSISLDEKINSLLKNMNSDNRLNIHIHIDDFGPSVKKEIPLTFYRIVQEQFSNIIKYAEATRAEITITVNDRLATLFIKDNGKGFDINKPKSGIGLQNIKRRAQVLGGEVQIISSPGDGCEVLVEIPCA